MKSGRGARGCFVRTDRAPGKACLPAVDFSGTHFAGRTCAILPALPEVASG
jgi:hypothetical protein